ncbi:hypothetical protein PF002_g26068 [Phytophthora fragariae]|uniref:Uncharacterized protein n=1 Tax=Phytophthora fragariae TaxID=53985 RepID=A0A6A3WIQ9_9STRA|nr:hypothetical protein PF002_g26068 [Phytophthora fragariae]
MSRRGINGMSTHMTSTRRKEIVERSQGTPKHAESFREFTRLSRGQWSSQCCVTLFVDTLQRPRPELATEVQRG